MEQMATVVLWREASLSRSRSAEEDHDELHCDVSHHVHLVLQGLAYRGPKNLEQYSVTGLRMCHSVFEVDNYRVI